MPRALAEWLSLAATLFVLRLLVTLGALRAGAAGGLLTPSVALGGLLGCILGGLWNHAWSSVPVGAFAIVGSAAFLASSMKMPLTSIILILEFTRVGHDFLFPLLLAVAGSVFVFRICTRRNNIPRRSQMGMSLAFHIIFATIGVSLPLMMTIAEWRWRATGDVVYLLLAKRWAKGTTILFAVGAVSGAVLSFELGLLWPRFMQYAGAVIGMPFSLEGFAFFTEAIFLGIYLYGWNRVPGWLHLLSGMIVAISGLLSAIFVTLVNG